MKWRTCLRGCFLFSLLFCGDRAVVRQKIGILIVATGKYNVFVDPLIQSARKYFCANHDVTYFVFLDGEITETKNVVTVHQDRLGWPFDTMMRFQIYDEHRDLYKHLDYLFCCDADMLFVGKVGDEILSPRVATLHPGFIREIGTYETRPDSLAFVNKEEKRYYFAGGFLGGATKEVLCLARTISRHINDDLNRGIIAVWHDESHWNRYCIDFKPTRILTPAYCYPESWDIGYQKKLLALDKDHGKVRE